MRVSSRPKAQEAPESVREAGHEWVRLWYSTLDVLLEQGTWRPEQRRDLEAYCHACRLSEFHRRQAENEPYTAHAESGRVFAHPGFGLARDAQREQRALAEVLVLTAGARKAHGVPDGSEEDPFADLDGPVTRLAVRRNSRRPQMAAEWPSDEPS